MFVGIQITKMYFFEIGFQKNALLFIFINFYVMQQTKLLSL